MPHHFDELGDYCILQSFKSLQEHFGFKSFATAAEALIAIDEGVDKNSVVEALYGHKVDAQKRVVAVRAMAAFLTAHPKEIDQLHCSEATRAYLKNLLFGGAADQGGVPPVASPPAPQLVEDIFENWTAQSHNRPDLMGSGLYQVFRRYKPVTAEPSQEANPYNWDDPLNHVVICELVKFEMEKRECFLVTSEGNKYCGTLHINHEEVLFCLLQRQVKFRHGLNHRFLAIRLPLKVDEVTSALLVKVGDTTQRPLASEAILIKIPASHKVLQDSFEKEVVESQAESVTTDSVIFNYLTDNPPPGNPTRDDPRWNRVRFVRDFGMITELVVPKSVRPPYLREPSRSLSIENVRGFQNKAAWKIFSHDEG
jgi:hypothetical protein